MEFIKSDYDGLRASLKSRYNLAYLFQITSNGNLDLRWQNIL